MRLYRMTADFNIGNDDDILEVADKWLEETVQMYKHPSCQFDIIEIHRVRVSNDTTHKEARK